MPYLLPLGSFILKSANCKIKSELHAQNDELHDQIGELQNQNSALQDRLDKIYEGPVQITAVEMIGWAPLSLPLIASNVDVTVQDNGFTDLRGLTLTSGW